MASDRKRYKIAGTLWYQKELTYGEDLELRPVLKVVSEKFGSGSATMSELIDLAFEGEVLKQLIHVVLKPYEPTPYHKVRNWLNARARGIDRSEILLVMTNSQVAEVLADFFAVNTRWIVDLPIWQSLSSSTFPQPMQTIQ